MGNLNMLPSDLILDILTRLPAETVLESKLVCKPWKNLVQHPSFPQMHLNHLQSDAENDSKLSIIIQSNDGLEEYYYTEYDDADEIVLSRKTRLNLRSEFHKCTLIGSCNGLICFNGIGDSVGPYYIDNVGPVFISNPITRECITLPDRKGDYFWNGFGYSPLTNEYKVVSICLCCTGPVFGFAQVYTVGDGNGWRSLGEMDLKWKRMNVVATCAGAFVNGALHWVNEDNGAILAFDVTSEKFSELPSPPCLNILLGVLGDVLSGTYYDNCGSIIWLLKKNEDNSGWSWSKHSSFNKCVWMPFEFTKSGRILWHGMELEGGIYIHDPKTSSAIKDTGFSMAIGGAIPHKNTFVLLKALGEKDAKIMEFPERARSMEVIGRSA